MNDQTKQDEGKLIAERRRKLGQLREQGNAYPNDFRRNATADELHQTFHEHDGETLREEDVHVAVVGRMMVKRVMGKASFIKLQDRSGQIQVRLERDRLRRRRPGWCRFGYIGSRDERGPEPCGRCR